MIPHGIRPSAEDSLLVVRARELLAGGPLDAVSLMERVCSLPGAPIPVAERLAEALFSRHADFVRDGAGRWHLAPEPRDSRATLRHPALPSSIAEPMATYAPARASLPQANDPDDVPLRAMRFAVVDVETTGTSSNGADRVTEIAVVHVDGGEVTEAFETLVNPQRSIPPAIVALTQITWEMVKDAPLFSHVADTVLASLRERVFVAHNAPFDWGFVSAEVARASRVRLAGDRLCTVRMARALLPQLPRRNLDSVTHYFGIEIAARHRAMGDALATAHVLTRLVRVAEDRGLTTWGDLSAAMSGGTSRKRSRRRSAWPRGVSVDPTL